MIRSMTGFGAASREEAKRHYAVEVRALNGRHFKAQVRVPEELAPLEATLESRLARRLSRGSVTVTVKYNDGTPDAAAILNLEVIGRYVEQLQSLPGVSDGRVVVDAGALVALPGAVSEGERSDLVELARPILEGLLDEACTQLIAMREAEGVPLGEELTGHVADIAAHLEDIRARAPRIVELYQERLQQRMESLLRESGATVRDDDVLREVAVFAERSDINEEIARLGGHIEQARELLGGDGSRPVGRTLDFLAQEMLREANTIGSKCLDGEVARRIVEIKGSIDRLKEQVQNVE